MRTIFHLFIPAVASLAACLLLTASCRAQQPYMTYNQMRAYRHFLNSPYSYRTYSSASPGYVLNMPTPYGEQQYFQGPGYVEQRITPRGFESYRSVPPAGYRFQPYPQLYVPPATPVVAGSAPLWLR